MERKLLLADDEEVFHRIIRRVFEGSGWTVETAGDGITALEKISANTPDAVILDLHMPGINGRDLLARMKNNPRLANVPVIILSGDGQPFEQAREFGLGADDFVPKPFDSTELMARVESAVKRARRMLSANPLTMLPGGPAIEEEGALRVASGKKFAFFYMDIDNFKAYNDAYGYLAGDEAIKRCADLLAGACAKEKDCFLGHIGGDDFVLMCPAEAAHRLAGAIADKFDEKMPALYNETDRARGFMTGLDRAGVKREFPLMSLTLAVASNEKRAIEHYAKLVDITREIKTHLKGLPGRKGSLYLKDRRVD